MATEMALNYLNQFNKEKYSWERLADVEVKVLPKGERLVEKLKEPFEFGLEEGIQEGIQKGIQKGIQEGKRERDKEIALQMLEAGADIRMICRCTGLSEGRVEELKKQSRRS